MKNKVYIQNDVSTFESLGYDIVSEYNGVVSTLARCWDYLLAEKIRDAVEDYMKSNYKVNPE